MLIICNNITTFPIFTLLKWLIMYIIESLYCDIINKYLYVIICVAIYFMTLIMTELSSCGPYEWYD